MTESSARRGRGEPPLPRPGRSSAASRALLASAVPVIAALAVLVLGTRERAPGAPRLVTHGGVPTEGRLLWLDGRATVAGDGEVAATDSSGRAYLVDERLDVRAVAVPGDVASITSAAPAGGDGGVWLVDGRGRLLRVSSNGSATGELRPPYPVAAIGSARNGELVLTRSAEGFPFVLDTAPEAPVVTIGPAGDVVHRFGTPVRPKQLLLSDLANSGRASRIDGGIVFAPFIRDEIVAFGPQGDTLWRLERGLDQETPEPRFLVVDGRPVLDYFPVNLGIGTGLDGRLYALSTVDSTLTRSRLDVIDPRSGRLLETFELRTAFPTIVVTRRGVVHALSSADLFSGDAEAKRPLLPAFEWPDLQGTRISETDLHGRVTLINLWASWCAPCRREMPELIELWRSISDLGLDFYAVNEDVDAQDARDWLTETGLAPPVLLAGGRAGQTFNYPGLPYTMLVDRDGRIAARWIGYLGPAQIDAIGNAARRELGPTPHRHRAPGSRVEGYGDGAHTDQADAAS